MLMICICKIVYCSSLSKLNKDFCIFSIPTTYERSTVLETHLKQSRLKRMFILLKPSKDPESFLYFTHFAHPVEMIA